jgi:predicted oxidoreductase
MIFEKKLSNQNFREMYIWCRTPRRQAPAAVSHGVKSLPPWGAAAGVRFLPQGGAAWRQDHAAERHGGRSVPLCHTVVGSFFIFLVFGF